MLTELKAEFRKLFTVRSTYVILAGMLLMVLFFAGYVDGYKADSYVFNNPDALASEITSALSFTAVFYGMIAILLFSHEYRYNTIIHTLTSSNRRSKVLLSKIVVVTSFAAAFGLILGALSPLASYAGHHLAGHSLVVQSIPFHDLLWRGLVYIWGYAMLGLLFVAITRNQVFSIVALFFFPITVEGIASLLLKGNAVYLPFTALNALLGSEGINPYVHVTHQKAALIFLTWLAGSWAVAWLLFLRRDATNNRS